jgi:hypothetical protein
MSLFLNRGGGISVFRVGVLMGVVGVLAVGLGILFFQLEHESRKGPFNVDLYPGAEQVAINDVEGLPRRTLVYRVQAEPESIVNFYQQQLDEHLNQDLRDPRRASEHELCVRRPGGGFYSNYEEGNGIPPYDFSCLFDNSFLDSTQVTVVKIEPGVRDDTADPPLDNLGYTYIFYEQNWSR